MPKPKIDSRVIARIDRPAAHGASAAQIVVSVCTVAPYKAPSNVRPRFATIVLMRTQQETTIGVRSRELPQLIEALHIARRGVWTETFEQGAGI